MPSIRRETFPSKWNCVMKPKSKFGWKNYKKIKEIKKRYKGRKSVKRDLMG
jgi:hypothetical protein